MALLIPVLRENQALLEGALSKIAGYDWADRRNIHLFPMDDPRSEKRGLIEYCQNNRIQNVLVPNRLQCGEKILQNAGYTVLLVPCISELVEGHALRDQLRKLGLDWLSCVLGRLSRYGLDVVGEGEVSTWLAQFERLGNHREVGEHLLQLLDVMSLADLGDSLCADSELYGADLVLGFNNDTLGKSGATVSNVVRKKCASATLLPITEAIQAGDHPKVLRLVEDGLFSGTEIQAIFDSLRGTRPPGRTQKVPSLPDPNLLSRVPIRLHFGVVCDFGEAAFRQYTASHSLPNIQVVVSAAAKTIRVLCRTASPNPQNDPRESSLAATRTFREQLWSRVVPYAFQDGKGWKSPDFRSRARTFCEEVGEQLWRRYIVKKKFDAAAWPEERIKRCALGMDGLGLAFAFPHSVPKASLPLFWAAGVVSLDGVSLDWAPLFPNADS